MNNNNSNPDIYNLKFDIYKLKDNNNNNDNTKYIMNDEFSIPDIYEFENNIYHNINHNNYNNYNKYITKEFRLASKQIINSYEIYKNIFDKKINGCYMYLETKASKLYFVDHQFRFTYIKIYNKMIKNIDMYEIIYNDSDYDSYIKISIIFNNDIKNNRNYTQVIEKLDICFLNLIETYKIYNGYIYIYNNIYVKTTKEIKIKKINISTYNIDFHYYILKISTNMYELKIKKIKNKINNNEIIFNKQINLSDIDYEYKKIKKKIKSVLNSTQVHIVNITDFTKLYNIVSLYSIPLIFKDDFE